MILAIDPGNIESGWVLAGVDASARMRVFNCGTSPNAQVLALVRDQSTTAPHVSTLAIEMMSARGMPVSNEEMATLVWVGRFQQVWRDPEAVQLVPRQRVKLHVCGASNAKDKNIRAALVNLVGAPGTKKNPGPTFGVAGHIWSALAVAVTALQLHAA